MNLNNYYCPKESFGARGDNMRMVWGIDLEELIEEADKYNDSGVALELGRLNERGCAIKKDLRKARYWYQKAADWGNGEAMYRLSLLVRADKYNKHAEVVADEWLQKSFLTGYEYVEEPNYLVETIISVVSLIIVAGFLWYGFPVVSSIFSTVF
jgi:TPR repeat protein